MLSATSNCQGFAGVANATRGMFAGGTTGSLQDIIQYTTIDTNGNTIDFGNLTAATSGPSGAGSATRGLFMAGNTPGNVNTITFVTISTQGNAADFGDLTFTDTLGSASSNAVRAIYFAQGTATINYLTIATLGNAQDFGDLTVATNHYSGGSPSSSTQSLFYGGGEIILTITWTFSGYNCSMLQIMSTGNAVDFGDLTDNQKSILQSETASNGHGGL